MKKNLLLLGFVISILGVCSSENLQAQTVYTLAGTGTSGFSGDGAAATAATMSDPTNGIALDAAGNVYIADANNNRIRKVTVATGIITTIAGMAGGGGFSGDLLAATAARLNGPTGVAVDASGNVFIADAGNRRIRMVNTTGIIRTVAGTGMGGMTGFMGDGSPATGAQIGTPVRVAVDGTGNVYFSSANQRVRVFSVGGNINTVAGNGTGGYIGDGLAATVEQLNNPAGLALDGSGNLFIADVSNNRIRKVILATNIISTFAGNGTPAFGPDAIAATASQINRASGVAVDATGNVYIADTRNVRIRMVDPAGVISTIAGSGVPGFANGPALTAQLNRTADIAVQSPGVYYFSDGNGTGFPPGQPRIRYVNSNNAPSFAGGTAQNLTVCENSGDTDINALLAVNDLDIGQTLTWSTSVAPTHGVLVSAATATSTGSTVTPTGLTYTPTTGYSGTDNFTVKISDGITSATTVISVTVNPLPSVAAIGGSGTGQLCIGASVTYTDGTPGGTWGSTSGNASVSAGGLVTGVAAGTDVISYSVTNSCGTVAATRSVTVNATVVPSVGISPAYGDITCPGVVDVITAVPIGGGPAPVFQWFVNGFTVGSGGATYAYIPAPGDIVSCIMTSNANCATPSVVTGADTLDGGTSATPSVTITSNVGDTSCHGDPVIYTAAAVNEGPTPDYQWTVNGVPTGTTNPFTHVPVDGDIIQCTLTSSIPCASPTSASSNIITMSVHDVVTPAVSVSASPGTTVCIHTSTTFTAVPVNGGSTPDYGWAKNGINVATGPTYTYVPNNGDHIVCTLHGAALCSTSGTATSSTVTMSVVNPVVPVVTIVSLHGTHIHPGQGDTLVAVITGTVALPTYQWFVNGISVPGAIHSNFVYTGGIGTALITCVGGSGDACMTTGTSNLISVVVGGVGVKQIGAEAGELTIQPNPNNGEFTMNLVSGYDEEAQVTITNVVGEKVKEFTATTNKDFAISLGQTPGIYFLSASTGQSRYVAKVLVK